MPTDPRNKIDLDLTIEIPVCVRVTVEDGTWSITSVNYPSECELIEIVSNQHNDEIHAVITTEIERLRKTDNKEHNDADTD